MRDSATRLFVREAGPDRRLLSANDWYGAGFLYGITCYRIDSRQRVQWYCTKQGAYEQYGIGIRDGMRVTKESDAEPLAIDRLQR